MVRKKKAIEFSLFIFLHYIFFSHYKFNTISLDLLVNLGFSFDEQSQYQKLLKQCLIQHINHNTPRATNENLKKKSKHQYKI